MSSANSTLLNPERPLLERVVSLHARYVQLASHLQSFVLLFLRLTIAWQLAESGYGHLTHIQDTLDNFRKWGIPFPLVNVYISGSTELVGGALLMLGLATRLIAVPLVFNFIVAYATASRGTFVKLFAGPNHLDGYDDFINDAAFTMLVLALAMLAFGPGLISIDGAIRPLFHHHKRTDGDVRRALIEA